MEKTQPWQVRHHVDRIENECPHPSAIEVCEGDDGPYLACKVCPAQWTIDSKTRTARRAG